MLVIWYLLFHRIDGEKIDDTFSRYISYHIRSWFNSVTVRNWKISFPSHDNFPSFDDLSKFLQNRSFFVEGNRVHNVSAVYKDNKKFHSENVLQKNKDASYVDQIILTLNTINSIKWHLNIVLQRLKKNTLCVWTALIATIYQFSVGILVIEFGIKYIINCFILKRRLYLPHLNQKSLLIFLILVNLVI